MAILRALARVGVMAVACAPAVLTSLPARAQDASTGQAAEPAGSCEDGVRNGSETDVDCGGADCPLCDLGQQCRESHDCVGGLCLGRTCRNASCEDGFRNQDETDVDCGGAVCPPCASQKMCGVDPDCASGSCRPRASEPGIGGRCAPGDTPVSGEEADVWDEDFPEEKPEPRRGKWYGAWLIPAYVLAPIIGTAASADADSVAPLLVAWFVAPTVHWAHGEGNRGIVSLLMQPVSLIGGGLAGVATADAVCDDWNCKASWVAMSAAGGYITWAVIDIATLAYHKPGRRRTSLMPTVTPLPGGGMLAGLASGF